MAALVRGRLQLLQKDIQAVIDQLCEDRKEAGIIIGATGIGILASGVSGVAVGAVIAGSATWSLVPC